MSQVITVYDSSQHCKATKIPQNLDVEMDCPYAGKGEKVSPGDLLESALAGCMLISIGTLAIRNKIDISGTKISVDIGATVDYVMRYTGITTRRIDKAWNVQPMHGHIKHGFRSDIPVTLNYNCPE